MIKKTLLASFVILILYNLYITYHLGNVTISRNQSQYNDIQAQKFIFSDSVYQNVIVGSSLSNHLPMDSLPGFYNLAFASQSIFDGLKILSCSRNLPHTIYIEMNVILKTETESFTENLENPLLLNTRKYIVALRDGKQPMDVASVYMEKLAFSHLDKFPKGSFNPANDPKSAGSFLSTGLAQQVKVNSAAPDTKKLDQAINNLKAYVEEFERKKVHIVFYEMPVNPIVNKQILPAIIRNKIFETFPPTKYKYVFQPDCAAYKTTDGVHMNGPELARYVHYFKDGM